VKQTTHTQKPLEPVCPGRLAWPGTPFKPLILILYITNIPAKRIVVMNLTVSARSSWSLITLPLSHYRKMRDCYNHNHNPFTSNRHMALLVYNSFFVTTILFAIRRRLDIRGSISTSASVIMLTLQLRPIPQQD
jgi:hypothetical protein